jgi:hypothetical protein
MSNNKSKKNRRKRITYKKFTSRGGKSQRTARTARYHKGHHSNIKRASAQCETKRRHNEHPSSRARFDTFVHSQVSRNVSVELSQQGSVIVLDICRLYNDWSKSPINDSAKKAKLLQIHNDYIRRLLNNKVMRDKLSDYLYNNIHRLSFNDLSQIHMAISYIYEHNKETGDNYHKFHKYITYHLDKLKKSSGIPLVRFLKKYRL